jgi:hypothetical protein
MGLLLHGCSGGDSGGAGLDSTGWQVTWTETTPLPQGLYSHAAATDGFSLFVAGGVGGNIIFTDIDNQVTSCPLGNAGVLDQVYQAGVGVSGTLPSWTVLPPMGPFDVNGEEQTLKVMGHGAVANGGFLYVLGGVSNPVSCEGQQPPANTVFSKDIISAPIGLNGTLGTWIKQPFPLPIGVVFYGYAVVANNLYVVGGFNGDDNNNRTLRDVYRAPISAGSVGSWTPLAPLPIGLNKHEVVASTKALYVIGGMTQDQGEADVMRSEAYYATISPNGDINPWTATTPLPHPLHYHAGAVIGDLAVVVIGGADLAINNPGDPNDGNVTHSVNEVWVSEIQSDNSLGPWQAVTPIPEARYRHAVVITGNALYVLGGERGIETSDQTTGGADKMATVYVGRVVKNQ